MDLTAPRVTLIKTVSDGLSRWIWWRCKLVEDMGSVQVVVLVALLTHHQIQVELDTQILEVVEVLHHMIHRIMVVAAVVPVVPVLLVDLDLVTVVLEWKFLCLICMAPIVQIVLQEAPVKDTLVVAEEEAVMPILQVLEDLVVEDSV